MNRSLAGNIQFECLYCHPQSAWLLAAAGGGDAGACISWIRPSREF